MYYNLCNIYTCMYANNFRDKYHNDQLYKIVIRIALRASNAL